MYKCHEPQKSYVSQPHFIHHSLKSLSCSSFSIIFLLSLRIFRESKAPSLCISSLSPFANLCMNGNSTGLFTNPLTASPLAFTASQPKQMHSRAKSRQLRRLNYYSLRSRRCRRLKRGSYRVGGRQRGKLSPVRLA